MQKKCENKDALLVLQRQKGICQQLSRIPFPRQLRYSGIISDTYSLYVDWYLYQPWWDFFFGGGAVGWGGIYVPVRLSTVNSYSAWRSQFHCRQSTLWNIYQWPCTIQRQKSENLNDCWELTCLGLVKRHHITDYVYTNLLTSLLIYLFYRTTECTQQFCHIQVYLFYSLRRGRHQTSPWTSHCGQRLLYWQITLIR